MNTRNLLQICGHEVCSRLVGSKLHRIIIPLNYIGPIFKQNDNNLGNCRFIDPFEIGGLFQDVEFLNMSPPGGTSSYENLRAEKLGFKVKFNPTCSYSCNTLVLK